MISYNEAYGFIIGGLTDHCANDAEMILLRNYFDDADVAMVCIIENEEGNFRAIKRYMEKVHNLGLYAEQARKLMYAYIDAAELALEKAEDLRKGV